MSHSTATRTHVIAIQSASTDNNITASKISSNGKINPAPWARVVQIPRQTAVSSSDDSNMAPKSKNFNPFKAKLLNSLLQNRLHLMNSETCPLESLKNLASKIAVKAQGNDEFDASHEQTISVDDSEAFSYKRPNKSEEEIEDVGMEVFVGGDGVVQLSQKDVQKFSPSDNETKSWNVAHKEETSDSNFVCKSIENADLKRWQSSENLGANSKNHSGKFTNKQFGLFSLFPFLKRSVNSMKHQDRRWASEMDINILRTSDNNIRMSHDDCCVGKYSIAGKSKPLFLQSDFTPSNDHDDRGLLSKSNVCLFTDALDGVVDFFHSDINHVKMLNDDKFVSSSDPFGSSCNISSSIEFLSSFRESSNCVTSSPLKESSDLTRFESSPLEDQPRDFDLSLSEELLKSNYSDSSLTEELLKSNYSDSFLTQELLNSNNSDESLKIEYSVEPDRFVRSSVSCCDSGIGLDDEATCISHPEDDHNWNKNPEEVLCGSRVSQMTQTYHDIEAVTRLLQEKEKDLQLAARIGQQLLGRNKALDEKNNVLESEVGILSEKITQLKHDLQMKTNLLQVYTNDVDESSTENTPTGFRFITVDLLQNKVQKLETENVSLRQEATRLATDTYDCEEKENGLVTDVIKQLNEANLQVHQLSDELSKKIEESLRQQDDTTQLLAQIVEIQASSKLLTRENEELSVLVGISRECQQELTTELADFKDKYAEVLALLHDTQEQLRKVNKKTLPGGRTHVGGMYSSSVLSGQDSIATELFSLSSGSDNHNNVDGTKCLNRVFDTVRLSSKLSSSVSSFHEGNESIYSTPTKLSSQTESTLTPQLSVGGRFSPYFGGGKGSSYMSSGLPSLDSGADSDGSFPTTDSDDNYPASRTGVPGWPGTPDLSSRLRRMGYSPTVSQSNSFLPYGCRTPDSIVSTGSRSAISGYSSGCEWKLPQKLQIVKPLEGSNTLHQWSRLATPHLGGLLEEKEGVAIKGATNNDINLELYSLSDCEEDEEGTDLPGKQSMNTSGVYTYTNSTVLHPDDVTCLTPSLRQSQTSAIITSASFALPSAPSTPSHSRRQSTTTFSTNAGLAKHLQERGVPMPQESMTITATPANSPDGSRPGSPQPYSSYKLPGLDDLTKSIHAGASFLKRTLYGRSSPENPRVRIVERVQAHGGANRFISAGGMTQALGGVVTLRTQPPSPLLQLSNLIRAQSTAPVTSATTTVSGGSIMSIPKITSPRERRPHLPVGAPMGIPGHPGSGHLNHRLTQLKPGQRIDLGSVGGRPSRPRTLGTVPGHGSKDEKMGTISWTSFGRKGGLL